MKKCIMLVLSAVLLLCVNFNSASAQAKKAAPKKTVVTLKAATVEKSRGENADIKTDAPTEDVLKEKSRAELCSVYFDSYCGYYVKLYVDGTYYGTLSPYSASTVRVYGGYTTIYCVSAGGTKEWKASGNCEGAYDYKLYCD